MDRATTASIADVLGAYTDEDHLFARTRTVVRLFGFGVRFVSRSEAKRLMRGLERFKEVTLDFAGVEEVGQGFVDEALRVWARQHEDTIVTPVGMTGTVEFMVRRGLPDLAPPGATEDAWRLRTSSPSSPGGWVCCTDGAVPGP